jgi:hypothetical protein
MQETAAWAWSCGLVGALLLVACGRPHDGRPAAPTRAPAQIAAAPSAVSSMAIAPIVPPALPSHAPAPPLPDDDVAVASVRGAPGVELVATVTGSPLSGYNMHPAGAPRWMALTDLLYDEHDAHFDVLDLATNAIEQITLRRVDLEPFGHAEQGPRGGVHPPSASLVVYHHGTSGLLLVDDFLTTGGRRHVYAEVDTKTGTFGRRSELGTFNEETYLHLVGAEPNGKRAWFWREHYDASPGAKPHEHARGPKELVLVSLDLETLAAKDVIHVPLPARKMVSRYEDRLSVHAASDFSRFAVVEYDEDLIHLTPSASVFVLDVASASSFAVPAMKTTYGVAFDREGKYLYLASANGLVARVDLAAKKIDKKVPGPTVIHDIAVSAHGGTLFVLASDRRFAMYDLPDLTKRRDVPFSSSIRESAERCFDGCVVSRDGQFFVMGERHPTKGPTVTIGVGPPSSFLVTRLVD